MTYNTLKSWVVHCPYGTPIFFKRDTSICVRFPYVDVEYFNNIKCGAVTMQQTIRGNFDGFTKIEVEKSNLARKSQTMLGSPYEKEYLLMVRKSTGIANCPVSPTDTTNSRVIYVPYLAGVIGKTMRKIPTMAET